MKYIDKFLKLLKTDRNTFATYILTLFTIYICVDRIIEIILIAATGMSVSYWGPLKYTVALACPVFAFFFSFASKFITDQKKKLSFTYIYLIAVYIIFVSMIIQWINQFAWLALLSVPNYSYIIINFMDLIRPAMSAIAWYIPITSFWPLFKFIYMKINDTKLLKDSITDYGGINLAVNKDGLGPYSCEMLLCKNKVSGKIIKLPEYRRFESMLVIGASGTGKTTMMFEPMIARDLEKKYLLKEASKEMGFTALRTGLANLNSPYDNSYINENFSLNMLTPVGNKEKLYKAYFKKLLYNYDGKNSVYKNLGITYLAPDYESVEKMMNVADNFGIPYHLVDPNNPNSIGINPFSYGDPVKTSIAISSVLRMLYTAEANLQNGVPVETAFKQNESSQAVENLVLLLSEMYPRLHDGAIASLEELANFLTNFDLVEEMAEQMAAIPELAKKYDIQLGYIRQTFYRSSENRSKNLSTFQATAAQLDNLMRYPGVRALVCNRTHNINYDDVLKNGEVVLCCGRRGDLGAGIHKAFGLFFILLMQHSVLSRPGSENTRIPHFLYIDEFPPFLCKATSEIFTLYRKYRVGTVVSAQNLSQLGVDMNISNNYRQTLLSNCSTKVVFGGTTPEDSAWWEKEFGEKRDWLMQYNYHTDKTEYDPNYVNIRWGWKENYRAGKVQTLKFKNILYKTRNASGGIEVGSAIVDFIEQKYKEPHRIKSYDFAKFTSGITYNNDNLGKEHKGFDLKHINFGGTADNPNNMEPIQMNEDGIHFSFENTEDGILNLKKNPETNNNSNNH